MRQKPQENPASKADPFKGRCGHLQFPALDYRQAWQLQQEIVAARSDGRLDIDLLLLLEHPAVFTMGRRGGLANLTVPRAFLKKKEIDVVQIERGGDITYHGPGQIVGYPIVHLRHRKLSVVEFVCKLEALMIRTAIEFGVSARVDPRNRGVWVGDNKLGSIGIAVRRGIAFHGFALNVNTDLAPFGWVNPCGLEGVGVTSLAAEKGAPVPMADVLAATCHHFETLLHCHLDVMTRSDLQQRLATPPSYAEAASVQP